MTAILLALIQAASAGCPADAAVLTADVDAGITAHAAQDWETFEASVAAVYADIGCLTELADVPQATRLHHLLALYFAHHGDEDNARDALRGALSLDGAFALEPAVVELEPVLEGAFAAAQKKGLGESQELPEGSWVVDGRPDSERLPTERATLVQRHVEQADISSWYVFGGQIPPELLPQAERDELAGESGGGLGSRPLLFGGLAGLAVAAGGLSWAELSWKATMDADMAEADAQARYQRAHGVSLGSAVVGVAGVGLVTGAVVIGRW